MSLADFQEQAFKTANEHGFWSRPTNLAEKCALIHSEVSELLEAYRHNPNAASAKCPTITVEAEEMADILIRLFDLAYFRGINLDAAVEAKSAYNATRPYKHGKAF